MARVGTLSKNAWDFVPTTIPGCSLWLDGADTSTMFTNGTNSIAPTTPAVVGNTVQYWRDKSQNALYALQTRGNSQPILQTEPVPGLAPQTSRTSLNFNGTQLMALPDGSKMPLGTSDAMYFAVCRLSNSIATNDSNLRPAFSHGGGTNSATSAPSRSLVMAGNGATGFVSTQTTSYSVPPSLYNPCLITGGIKDYIQFGFLNGSAFTNVNLINNQGNQFVTSGGTLSTNAYIGAPAGGGIGVPFIGNISEILVYNRALNNYERQQIEGYLALKWGVTPILPEATHPYYNPLERGFTPFITAGGLLRLWLDASTLTGENGSAVTTWTGYSNTGVSDSTTAPTLVTNSLNGRNTVAFNGSQFMDVTSSGFGTNGVSLEMLFVAQPTNATPAPSRQTVFTQGGTVYPNALNTSASVSTGYFNSSNNLCFDTLGSITGVIPTSTASYTNNYVVGWTRNNNTVVGWDNGKPFPQSVSYSTVPLLRETGRIGASRGLSTMTLTATSNSGNTATIAVLSGGPPCVNQIIIFSQFNPAILGGIITNTSYYITGVTGTSSPYTITVSLTYGGASPTLTTTTGQSVPAQAFTTINATSQPNSTVTITSSTPPTVNQPIIFGGSVGGINARGRYYIQNIVNSAPPSYTVRLSNSTGGAVVPITSTTTNQGVPELLVSDYFTGNIAEVIYFFNNGPLRQRLEGYLAWKWGLQASLPTSHPFYLANYFYNATKPTSRIFAPPDIEGCQLWIDPTDLQTAGYAVSAWNDKTSGTAYHATQTTANLRPYYIPAQKGIYFATSEYLSLPNSALSLFQNVGYASMFMVVRVPQPSTTVGGALFGANTTAGTDRFRPSIVASSSLYATYGAILQRANSDAVVTSTSGVAYPYGGMTILNIEVTYSTNSARFSRNGTQDYLGTAGLAAAGVTDNTASTLITVGAPVGGRQDNFYMHELLLYTSATNSPLSTADRDFTHGYLAWKWGLQTSLPSTSAYSPFNTTPATAGPSAAATGYKLWLDASDSATITYTANSVAMLMDKSGSENPVVNNQSTLTMTTYTKPEGTTLPMLKGDNSGAYNTLTTRTIAARDTSNHTYAFVVKYPNSGNASFAPTQIPGCALWLDASNSSTTNMTLVGNSVSVWKDLSGNGRNATPVSAAPQLATNIQNGLPGILFSGAGTMKCGAFLTSTNLSMFSVSNTNGGGYDVSVWKVQFGSLAGIASSAIVTAVNKTGGYVPNFINFTDRPRVSGLTLASSTTAGSAFTMNASVNGRNTLITGTSTNGNADTCAQEVAIGGLIQSGTIAGTNTGHIHEVIVFNVELTTAQRQQIEGYLAWKWGLQPNLPTTHPYTAISPIPKTVLSYTPPTPLVLSGLGLWLDASNAASVIRSGNNVTRWNDLSGNGRNMLYDVGTLTYNATGFNGNPTITFGSGRSGFTYSANSVDLSSTNSLSIYIVLRPSSTSSGNTRILSFYNGNDYSPPGFNVQLAAGRINIGIQRGGDYASYNTTNVINTNIFTSIIFNGNLSTNPAVPLNNTGIGINGNAFSNFTGYSIGTNFSTYNPFRIGEWQGATADIFNGNISEIIMFTRALNATENQQIEGYLATKWGLQTSLPNTHLYASPYGAETFGHSGTDTNPRLENYNNIPGGIATYSPYGSFGSADAFYGGNTFVCMCVRQNGVWTFTTNGVNYGTISPYALRKLASGTYSLGVNNFSSAQLGDVIVYNNAISPGEQQQLEGYLAWKWGLQRTVTSTGNSLPTTHPFYNYPPSTTVPLVNATQLYKKTFDITDLAPALWLDANDPNTYALDANNRVQWISNKGLGLIKISFNLTSASGSANFTASPATNLSPGQAFEIVVSGATITGIPTVVSTPTAPVFFYVLTVSGTTITISNTFGGTALTGAGAGTSQSAVSQRFTKPVGTSSGVGLNGPLLTQSAVGTGNGLNYLDFSSGGTFKITGGSTNSTGTSVTLTLNATHNIPATRQARVVVSGGTYSTDASSATGITGTYIVSAQTGTTITVPYTSSKNSATINNMVGYVEYGSIILQNITMNSGNSAATFNTSFAHGLNSTDSIFLSLAGNSIANFGPLNLANGVYTPTSVPNSTSFTINVLNLNSGAITATGDISSVSLLSSTSPSYAYFPYNGYALESLSATGMLPATNTTVFMVTHINPGSGSFAASSIARCGRNTSTQPSIFATSTTPNSVSGDNGVGTGVFGTGRDFNVRLANYNAVGNNFTTSTSPSIRLGTKRCGLSSTSVALTDTSRSVTNTTSGFRIMTAQTATTTGNAETGIMSTAVTSCAWKPSNGSLSTYSIPLMNTSYMNATQGALQIYQVSSTGSNSTATATFVPYGCETTDNPYYVGQTISVASLTGAALGYNNASTTVTAATPTTISYTTAIQQNSGTITGQKGNTFLGGSYANVITHIRIGADTCATTGYSSLAGYLTDRFFDGGIAEILVFNSNLSESQRMLVEGYLAQKYNCQDYMGATTNYIANGRAFTVGNNSSNVTSSGSTVTITFDPGASTVNPFIPGSGIVVAATSLVPAYTGTYIVTGNSGTNQVSYSVAGNSGNATTVTGVTLTSTINQSNLFIHPYSAGPANIASNLSVGSGTGQVFSQNLALWYDAANYSSLTLGSGSSVLTWSSRLGTIAYGTNVLSPINSLFPLKYVTNSLNGLPGLEVMSTVARSGVTLTATSNSGNLLTVTSGTPIVQYQLIILASSGGGLTVNTYYIVRSVPTFTSPNIYTFQVAAHQGALATPVTLSTNSPLNISSQLFTGGSMTGALVTTSAVTTTNTNTEFTYFYVFKRLSGAIVTSGDYINWRGTGGTGFRLGSDFFTFSESGVNTIDYSTRGGFVNDTPMILAVYKRGRDLYSRMIGGGKTSQFVQTFSRDNQILATSFTPTIGLNNVNAPFTFNGTLYEMMFFRDAITDQAIQQTEGYLAQKWGLRASLPPTHAYYEVTS